MILIAELEDIGIAVRTALRYLVINQQWQSILQILFLFLARERFESSHWEKIRKTKMLSHSAPQNLASQ